MAIHVLRVCEEIADFETVASQLLEKLGGHVVSVSHTTRVREEPGEETILIRGFDNRSIPVKVVRRVDLIDALFVVET